MPDICGGHAIATNGAMLAGSMLLKREWTRSEDDNPREQCHQVGCELHVPWHLQEKYL
jgi:hypothetical protein